MRKKVEQMQKLIFECDRCKKTISDEEQATFEKRNIRLYDHNGDEYDICSECFESLDKWFDREPGEREDSCQFCKYVDKDVHEEPCSKCKYNFLDKFEFRQKGR